MRMTIRKIKPDEVDEALALALEVFMEYEAPDYKPEGTKTFQEFLKNEDFLRDLRSGAAPAYAAFDEDMIAGIIAMRSNRTHICLVFVRTEYHRQGVATAIFRYLLEDRLRDDPGLSELTLNSSPYGRPFYLHLGFVPLSEELEEDGIRYTPMKYVIRKRG